MKKLYIVANWKSNKTQVEAIDWVEKWIEISKPIPEEKTVIVCPSFTLLSEISFFVAEHKLPIKIGSQDIAPFESGAYTGAVNAGQVKEFGEYAIIGHSERRKYFGETDELLAKKVDLAKKAGLVPVYCVRGKEDSVPEGVTIVAYEPVAAIGSGNPDTPENAHAVAETIKTSYPFVQYVLYGGSVTPENVSSFTQQELISGVLVGGASLKAEVFFELANNA